MSDIIGTNIKTLHVRGIEFIDFSPNSMKSYYLLIIDMS